VPRGGIGRRSEGGGDLEKKSVLFEKKNQKTSVTWLSAWGANERPTRTKVFLLLFLQKKKTS
jgi:hypothetical protein